jgi:ribosome-binding protein aMBF1 (putative translation factor)
MYETAEVFRRGFSGPAPASRGRAQGKPGRDRFAGSTKGRSRQLSALLRMLVRLREDGGLNQTDLADRLGITQSEISKFERGERALDVIRLRAWLRALGIEFKPFADALDRELERLEGFVD